MVGQCLLKICTYLTIVETGRLLGVFHLLKKNPSNGFLHQRH